MILLMNLKRENKMKNKIIAIEIILVFILICLSGCNNIKLENEKNISIEKFMVDSSVIKSGDTTNIYWEVLNAQTVYIDNGIGNVNNSGNITIEPIENTTYTLIANNGIKTINATILIIVNNIENNRPYNESINPNKIYYVDINGSTNFSSIQDAINESAENYTIYVYNGHYIENLIINININLIGENADYTIIDGKYSDDVIVINSDNVILSNFTIKNSGNKFKDSGIMINSKNVKINNNIIFNNNCGIYLISAENTKIKNNTIKLNSEYGIYAYTSSNNMKIFGNKFFLNDCSLRVKGSRRCEIFRNQFNNSNKGMYFCCGARSNIVYQNSFMNHSLWNADDLVGTNKWFNITFSEGNYWDDYTGIDINDDGIGETPYNITNDETNNKQDLFPMMKSYSTIQN